MATKRIYDLTNATSLNASDKVPVDRSGGTARSILATDFANAVRPFASTLEAQTGTATDKTMTPATTFTAWDAKWAATTVTSAKVQNGAITAAKLYRDIKSFNAIGNDSADDTAAINAAFAAAVAGTPIWISEGRYRFSGPLTALAGGNITIHGNGALIYAGASTNPGDLIIFGNGTDTFQNLDLRGWRIGSVNAMTGSRALRIRKFLNVNLDLILNEGGNLYDGAFLENCSYIYLHNTRSYVINKDYLWTDGVEFHCMQAWIGGRRTGGAGTETGIGIHCGGGCGGFYSENIDLLFKNIGLLVDTSVSANGNTQFFLNSGTFDTCKTAGVLFNDSVSNPVGKHVGLGGWFASSTAGSGVTISNWRDGRMHASGVFVNNMGPGIYLNDATVNLTIPETAVIKDNVVGVDAGTTVTVQCNAKLINNTTNYGANVRVVTLNSATTTISIANGANAILAAVSGLIAVTNTGNGDVGLYLVGGGGVQRVSTSTAGTWAAPTTTPSAGQCSVAYDGSSAYRIYNNYGSTQGFSVMILATRNSI